MDDFRLDIYKSAALDLISVSHWQQYCGSESNTRKHHHLALCRNRQRIPQIPSTEDLYSEREEVEVLAVAKGA